MDAGDRRLRLGGLGSRPEGQRDDPDRDKAPNSQREGCKIPCDRYHGLPRQRGVVRPHAFQGLFCNRVLERKSCIKARLYFKYHECCDTHFRSKIGEF